MSFALAIAPALAQSYRVLLEVTPGPVPAFSYDLILTALDSGHLGATLPGGGEL